MVLYEPPRFYEEFLKVAAIAAVIRLSQACHCARGFNKVVFQNGTFNFCRPCSGCPPTLGLTVPCDTEIFGDVNIECKPCTPGKNYSSRYDFQSCQPCRSLTCNPNEKFDGECSAEKDTTKCTGTCTKGYFWTDDNRNPCQPCSLCRNARNFTRIKKCVKDGMPRNKQCKPQLKNEGQTHLANQTKFPNRALEKNRTTLLGVDQISFTNVFKGKNYSQFKNYPTTKRKPEKNEDEGQPSIGLSALIVIIVAVVLVIAIVLLVCYRRRINRTQQRHGHSRISRSESDNVETTDMDLEDKNHSVDRGSRKSSSDNGDPLETIPRALNPVSHLSHNFEETTPSLNTPGQTPPSKIRRLSNIKNEAMQSFSTLGGTPPSERTSLLNDKNGTTPALSTPGQTPPSNPRSLLNIENVCKLETFLIGDLNPDVHRELCQLLDKLRPLGGDYMTLAGIMGYCKRDIDFLELYKHPTRDMLEDWSRKQGNTVLKLKNYMEKMERNDVVELLQKQLELLQCNCSNCGDDR